MTDNEPQPTDGDQRTGPERSIGLEELVRVAVADALGPRPLPAVEHLTMEADRAVSMVRLSRTGSDQVIVKLALADLRPVIDYRRTATITSLARAAGVPAPTVVAVGTIEAGKTWQYQVQEHVVGLEWLRLRPMLDRDEIDAADQQIAQAIMSVQTVRFPTFGELSASGEVDGSTLVEALQRRAELRVRSVRRRAEFRAVLDRHAALFSGPHRATLCHDDLHHGNLVFRRQRSSWALAAVLDWDKSWAGPVESDLARMETWDDMSGAAAWVRQGLVSPAPAGAATRALIYQLLWCLEYEADTPRHRADTAAVRRRLAVRESS